MRQIRSVQRGGTRGTVFEVVARIRLADGDVLMSRARYHGAIYLAGYAIECMLKYAVTRKRNALYLPRELEIHDWDVLLQAAGLARAMQRESILLAVYSEMADRWGPELRYLSGRIEKREAERLYQQIKQVYAWIIEQLI